MADYKQENERLRTENNQLLQKVKDLESIMKQNGISIKNTKLQEYGELIAWTVMFKKSHPGSLSSLRKAQREVIVDCIQEFLKMRLGARMIKDCVQDVRGKPEIAIPESLIDDFQSWFNLKIDEGSFQ